MQIPVVNVTTLWRPSLYSHAQKEYAVIVAYALRSFGCEGLILCEPPVDASKKS